MLTIFLMILYMEKKLTPLSSQKVFLVIILKTVDHLLKANIFALLKNCTISSFALVIQMKDVSIVTSNISMAKLYDC